MSIPYNEVYNGMSGTIVIVDDEPIIRMDIRDILEEANYKVVGEASDGFEAIKVCEQHVPDLVIMDIQMPLLDGLKASKRIMSQKLAKGVVLLTAFSDSDCVEKAKSVGALGYLVKPLDEKSLIPMVEVSIARGNDIQRLGNELDKVSQKLDERKVIEKAKGILMNDTGLKEEEAYQMLRKLSMDRRCPIIEIAKTIVETYE